MRHARTALVTFRLRSPSRQRLRIRHANQHRQHEKKEGAERARVDRLFDGYA